MVFAQHVQQIEHSSAGIVAVARHFDHRVDWEGVQAVGERFLSGVEIADRAFSQSHYKCDHWRIRNLPTRRRAEERMALMLDVVDDPLHSRKDTALHFVTKDR